jgi:hypothetical protein
MGAMVGFPFSWVDLSGWTFERLFASEFDACSHCSAILDRVGIGAGQVIAESE